MIPSTVRTAVDGFLEAVEGDPTKLPLAEVAALHGTGHDVSVERGPTGVVVYATPRPNVVLDDCTRREREVAMLAVGGFSNQQIAVGLGISVHTVKDHIHSILSKTALDSRGQLIAAWYGGLLRRPCSNEE